MILVTWLIGSAAARQNHSGTNLEVRHFPQPDVFPERQGETWAGDAAEIQGRGRCSKEWSGESTMEKANK